MNTQKIAKFRNFTISHVWHYEDLMMELRSIYLMSLCCILKLINTDNLVLITINKKNVESEKFSRYHNVKQNICMALTITFLILIKKVMLKRKKLSSKKYFYILMPDWNFTTFSKVYEFIKLQVFCSQSFLQLEKFWDESLKILTFPEKKHQTRKTLFELNHQQIKHWNLFLLKLK